MEYWLGGLLATALVAYAAYQVILLFGDGLDRGSKKHVPGRERGHILSIDSRDQTRCQVQIGTESWDAVMAPSSGLREGDAVKVTGRDGFTLTVEPANSGR